MIRRWALALGALGALTLGACEQDQARVTGPEGSEAFEQYVAIGTSLSAGYMSNGLVYSSQAQSWPALLADQAGARFRYPAISAPGCSPPLIAPLQLSRRLSGTSAAAADATCAPNLGDVTIPTHNLAVPGATTEAALAATPNGFGATTFARMLYSRILPPNQSQVTAMTTLNPTLVSVELGANEVLGAVTSGRVTAGVTYVPFSVWEPLYVRVVNEVVEEGSRALLTTVPLVSRIPSIRTGHEIYLNRQVFAAFNVVVNENCNGSQNLVFTPNLVATKLGEGQALAAAGQQAQLSCETTTGGTAVDFILTPADAATIEGVVTQMNDRIVALAEQHGFALLDANAVLQQFIDERPPFNLLQMLQCVLPYGQYTSLDGVHPNGYGYQLVANAAAQALNAEYGFSIPTVPVPQFDACSPPE